MTLSRINLIVISIIIIVFTFLFVSGENSLGYSNVSLYTLVTMILISFGVLFQGYGQRNQFTKKLIKYVSVSILLLGSSEILRSINASDGFNVFSDSLWVMHILLLSVGLIFVLTKVRSNFQMSYLLFDLHITITVLGAISFVTYEKFAENDALLYTVFYPLGSLYVLFILATLFLIVDKPIKRPVLNGLFLGLSICLLSDIFLLFDSLDGVLSREKYLLLDGLGIYIMSCAFYRKNTRVLKNYKEQFSLSYTHWEVIRPIIQYTGVFVLLYEYVFVYRNNDILFGGLIATFVLVICRDIISIIQNQSLVKRLMIFNQHLEKKIGERTQELSDSHRDLENAFKQIDYIAMHDTFSHLPNRRYLEKMIEWKIMDSKRDRSMVALIFIDVDRLKHVNDTLGHSIGDQLLLQIIERIKSCLPKDVFMARQGGDEFSIVIEDLYYEEDIKDLTMSIVKAFEHSFHVNEKEISVTLSIGVSFYPEQGDTVEELMKNADLAMYKAKEDRQSRIVFYAPEMDKELVGRMELLTDLNTAIKRNEFKVYYQPQFDIHKGNLSGVEALVRWDHPVRGLIPPSEFIPLAEEFDLIIPIDEIVLKTALKQFEEWERIGIAPPRLSVNLCPQQFVEGNLCAKLAMFLENTTFPANKLVVEITESIAMNDEAHLTSQLHEIAAMGVQISIDDFGTGYSSLSYVKNYPLNQLKIARPFIMDVPANLNDIAMIRAIIDLSHHFNLSVVVEGVETVEQLNFLQSIHCEEVQGFYFSKPLSSKVLEERYLQAVTQSI